MRGKSHLNNRIIKITQRLQIERIKGIEQMKSEV